MGNWNFCGHSIPAGEVVQAMISPNVEGQEMPATLINGAKEGKTVLITAAAHGDEYPGIAASIQFAKAIDPAVTAGRIIIFHCVNIGGFWERTRNTTDNANLNGNFPGDANGAEGARIADFFVKSVLPQVDFLIDLHSGSATTMLTPCLFFSAGAEDKVRQASETAAHATNIPYLLASRSSAGLYSFAATYMGIPSLLLERGHGGQCRDEWVKAFIVDIQLLLAHLKVYPYQHEGGLCQKHVIEQGNFINAKETGLWYPNMVVGEHVKKGDVIGRMEDFWGNLISEYYAQTDGTVFYYVTSLAVQEGQPLAAYG